MSGFRARALVTAGRLCRRRRPGEEPRLLFAAVDTFDAVFGRPYGPLLGGGVQADPDPRHISTSYVERQKLTMRMHMHRFTRLTSALWKKFENHVRMVALYTVSCN